MLPTLCPLVTLRRPDLPTPRLSSHFNCLALHAALPGIDCPLPPQVCAVTEGGAFGEQAVARENLVVKLPANCDVDAAAGLPIAYGTAYLALRDRADLRPGELAGTGTGSRLCRL